MMVPIIRAGEREWQMLEKCHDGIGTVRCRPMLEDGEAGGIEFMHYDDMPAGVSIGEHLHADDDEIYYLLAGKGVLSFDGKEYEMNPGDLSVCNKGHSHGYFAKEDSKLIVVGWR